LLQNWIRLVRTNLDDNGDAFLQCTLFVAIDSDSYDLISEMRFLKWKVCWAVKENSQLLYGSSIYFMLMLARMKLIGELLSKGVNVAVMEVRASE